MCTYSVHLHLHACIKCRVLWVQVPSEVHSYTYVREAFSLYLAFVLIVLCFIALW